MNLVKCECVSVSLAQRKRERERDSVHACVCIYVCGTSGNLNAHTHRPLVDNFKSVILWGIAPHIGGNRGLNGGHMMPPVGRYDQYVSVLQLGNIGCAIPRIHSQECTRRL